MVAESMGLKSPTRCVAPRIWSLSQGDLRMPSRSIQQSKLMHAAAANQAVARRVGIPTSVAQDFVTADHGRSLKGLPERVQHKAEGGPVRGVYPCRFEW